MAVNFIVEDNTGLSTATSYVSDTDLDQFIEDNGFDVTFADATEKQQYLNRYTKILDASYTFGGTRLKDTQALQFPRKDFYYTDGVKCDIVPSEIINALCLYVIYAKDGTDFNGVITNGGLKSKSESVSGAVSVSEEYFGASASNTIQVTEIDKALYRVIGRNTGKVTLYRV